MGCHKMAKDYNVSGRKKWSPLLNFPERSSNTRTENCSLGSAKWRVPVSGWMSASVRPEWSEERARG